MKAGLPVAACFCDGKAHDRVYFSPASLHIAD